MPLSVEDLRDHLAYSAWASQRLVHAASELTEAELVHDCVFCRLELSGRPGSSKHTFRSRSQFLFYDRIRFPEDVPHADATGA
jgi:hypothetical protein